MIKIKALMEVLQSKEIQDYIKDKYDGAVMLSNKNHSLNACVKRVIYIYFIIVYLHHRIPFDNQILEILYLDFVQKRFTFLLSPFSVIDVMLTKFITSLLKSF